MIYFQQFLTFIFLAFRGIRNFYVHYFKIPFGLITEKLLKVICLWQAKMQAQQCLNAELY